MKYDFDKVIDRTGTSCEKHSFMRENGLSEDTLGMWVADMEFATAPAVCQAMKERIDRRIFGYTNVFGTDYYEALKKWCEDLYGWSFPQEELTFSSGIIPPHSNGKSFAGL